MKWFINALIHYADFSGRVQRKEYWLFVVFNVIFSIVWILTFTLLKVSISDDFNLTTTQKVISLTYIVLMLLPSTAVTVRRLHDIGKSGGMILVGLIPIVGFIWLLILLLTNGQQGNNAYGADPKKAHQGFSNSSKTQSVGLVLLISGIFLSLSVLIPFVRQITSQNEFYHFRFSIIQLVSAIRPILLLLAGIWICQIKDIYKSEPLAKRAFVAILGYGAAGLILNLSSGYFFTGFIAIWFIYIMFNLSVSLLGASYLWGTKKTTRYAAISLLIFSPLLLMSSLYFATLNGIFDGWSVLNILGVIVSPAFIVLTATLLSKEQELAYDANESDFLYEADEKVVYNPSLPSTTVDQQPQAAKKSSIAWKVIGLFVSIGLIIGGLSGDLVLRGTDSSGALIAFGCIMLIADIFSIVNHNRSNKKRVEYEQQVESGKINVVELVAPATIRVIRDSSIIGAIVPYSVYLNHSFVGKIKNGKSLEITTHVSHNIITVFDHNDIAFKGNYTTDLKDGGYAEVHVKAGRFVSK